MTMHRPHGQSQSLVFLGSECWLGGQTDKEISNRCDREDYDVKHLESGTVPVESCLHPCPLVCPYIRR
jgi:hypothetical protein